MKNKQTNPETYELSVAQWYELVLGGADVPVTFRLNGCSMQPLIRKQKDTVTVMPLSRPLRKGDIVLFARSDGAYVVHRVYKLKGKTVTTLGDNCVCCDAPMPVSQVRGLAVCIEKNGKKISTDCAFSRAYGRVRMASRPLRSFWKKLLRFCVRVKRKSVSRNG